MQFQIRNGQMFTFKELNEIFKNAFKQPDSRYEQLMKLKGYSESNILGLNPVAQARTREQIAKGLPAEHLPLPPGMKFEQTIIELDLGPRDILMIQSDRLFNQQQRDTITKRAEEVLKAPGRACFILDAGLTYSVLHRKDSDE
jgi:hypothetical protein